MTHFDDDDLKPLLQHWHAPDPPERLRLRIFGAPRRPAWAWLLTGRIPVPVPAVAVLLMLMMWLAAGRWSSLVDSNSQGNDSEQPLSLADFHPPTEMRVRIVREVP